ncbi:MAG TPA: GNAT family N-acetyltransferase [Gemmatimonadales bacterium]|nr:GNAT family N-acetyltransferase [Gemmatimonadales bacterium]
MQVTRTYLELTDPAQFKSAFGDFPDITLVHVPNPPPKLYRHCYRTVGEAFHWRDRWDWSDDQITLHLVDPNIQLHVATRDGDLAGWYELRRVAEDDSVEIAYFGIVQAEFGRGFGKHLLSCAVRDAWAWGPKRVWLHTCTLDHRNALPNYIARGFTPYKTEQYEVESPRGLARFLPVNFNFQLTRKRKLTIAAVLLTPVLLFVVYTWSTLAWSYSKGERAGYVQKFSKKGWVCKTWEGELAMVSIPGTTPEKFYFTVRDDAVAQRINASIGKRVALSYEQHTGVPLRCFGETEYFVTNVRVVE